MKLFEDKDGLTKVKFFLCGVGIPYQQAFSTVAYDGKIEEEVYGHKECIESIPEI